MAYKKYDAYHLGMQPEEVKEALQGGGGGMTIISGIMDENEGVPVIDFPNSPQFETSAECVAALKSANAVNFIINPDSTLYSMAQDITLYQVAASGQTMVRFAASCEIFQPYLITAHLLPMTDIEGKYVFSGSISMTILTT